MSNFDDVFSGPDAFDQSAADAASSSQRERPRDKWPVLKFAVGSSGSEEVAIRITPVTAKTRGHWVKTSKDKTFWADCVAYDAQTDTSNGVCPYCTLGEAATTNTVSICLDMNSYNWLMSMGYTPDKWMAPPPGTMPNPNQPLMHPFRFFSFSKSMLSQIHTVKTKRNGIAASDVNQGYMLDIIKKNNNGKVEYQVIAGNMLPISDDIKMAFQRIGLANPKDWHCPEKVHDIIKSLFFNNKVTKDQAISMLTKYAVELGMVTDDDKSAAIKAMESYAAKHQADAGGAPMLPPPTGMGFQNPQLPPPPAGGGMMPPPPAPGMGMMPPPNPMAPAMPPMPAPPAPAQEVAAPQVPAPATPPAPMVPPAPTPMVQAPTPAAPSMPAMPSMPAAPQVPAPNPMMPSVPTPGMPGMPPAPMIPQAPVAPMIPQAPVMPSIPSAPSIPQAPAAPTAAPTSELPVSAAFTPPAIPTAPTGAAPIAGATNILD